MLDFYNIISNKGLNPNQYYLLYCISKGVKALNINIHLEQRILLSQGFLDNNNTITPKGVELILDVNSFFLKTNDIIETKVSSIDNIERYLLIFPNVLLPSGKYARSNKKNLEGAFKWFFKNYKYSWETIYKATNQYVAHYELHNWKFMKTSLYFIKKSDVERNTISELADHCQIVENGCDNENIKSHFKDKVV